MKTVVVTGGSKGIGRACATRFLKDGHKVIIVGRSVEALGSTIEELGQFGDISSIKLDVTDESAVGQLISGVGTDILVASAGREYAASFDATSRRDFSALLDVNVLGVFLTSRAVCEGMVSRGWGRIIAIGSTASHGGLRYGAAYSASKHALLGLIRSLSLELRGSGVTANLVSPGFVNSEMTHRSADRIVRATGRSFEEAYATLAKMNSGGRLIEPEEVADAVACLASNDAQGTTGRSLVLEGDAVTRYL